MIWKDKVQIRCTHDRYSQVDLLVKKYGDFIAVNGISISVEEGEIFGLPGPNGASKTQTISLLTGVISLHLAQRGSEVSISTKISLRKEDQRPGAQALALYPTLSARANLNFFGQIYGLGGEKLKQRVDDVLEVVVLTGRVNQAVEKYFGGMKRRVNIAASLVSQPHLSSWMSQP